MTMDAKEFKEKILLYGADLDEWPEELRQAGVESLRNYSDLQALLVEQEKFETVLKARKYEEPSADLVQRIVSLSWHQDKKSPFGLSLFLARLFSYEFDFPKTALLVGCTVMIAALVTGFVIGFSYSPGSMLTNETQVNLQDFLHSKGDVPWAKE